MHCPEAAQPIVTLLAVVLERGGQINGGSTLLHYHLESTTYSSRRELTTPSLSPHTSRTGNVGRTLRSSA
jgi:hypothetical protein